MSMWNCGVQGENDRREFAESAALLAGTERVIRRTWSRGLVGSQVVGSLPEREERRFATRSRFREGWVEYRRFGIVALIKPRGARVASHDTVMSLL